MRITINSNNSSPLHTLPYLSSILPVPDMDDDDDDNDNALGGALLPDDHPGQAKPAPNSKPLPPKTTTTTITRAQPPSYAEQLAAKGRTLLYEAPSHFWFRTSSFMSGAFCVSYTVYQYWAIYLHPPEGLYWWIPNAFAVICVFMVGMGGYFVHGTRRIVRSIEAVPARMVKMAATGASSGAATTTTTTPRASDLARRSPVYIEVTTRRVLPFLPPKKMLYRPDEIQLPFRMQGVLEGARLRQLQMEQPKSLLAQVRAARAKQEQIEKERKHTLDHIMTAPFRDFAKVVGTAARGMQRAFNREGFTKLKLKDTEYKLDVSGGWALDDGRALDRLLTVKQRR
ncbi:hypothetical protein B0T17DRAFT_653949 [Bombardia bombarda]|uniref:Uncharacterized protein n=1 Tax=Bombardia bombarda TaxID=252184 RepID=A0AA39XAV5_9PEZI|nr:hypothetical protein B0T17DRAFT_653949 [Bombardia bombarda]